MDTDRETPNDNPTASDGTADAPGIDPSENGHAPTEEDGTPVENPSG